MLSEFFYHKDNWKLCQFIDSQIATKIMVHFASKGEVCLNYHDSWIVTYHNKQELINVMRDSWEHVIGNLDNFGYDIEFDNTPKVKQGHPAFESIPIEYYEE
jgi:archaellin